MSSTGQELTMNPAHYRRSRYDKFDNMGAGEFIRKEAQAYSRSSEANHTRTMDDPIYDPSGHVKRSAVKGAKPKSGISFFEEIGAWFSQDKSSSIYDTSEKNSQQAASGKLSKKFMDDPDNYMNEESIFAEFAHRVPGETRRDDRSVMRSEAMSTSRAPGVMVGREKKESFVQNLTTDINTLLFDQDATINKTTGMTTAQEREQDWGGRMLQPNEERDPKYYDAGAGVFQSGSKTVDSHHRTQ